MYTIVWFDGMHQYEACTGKPDAAWAIYWAVKRDAEQTRPQMDAWIYMTRNGQCVDPESGTALVPCEFKRIIMKKGAI